MERGYIMPAAVLGVSLCSGRGVDDGQLQVRVVHGFRSQVPNETTRPLFVDFYYFLVKKGKCFKLYV